MISGAWIAATQDSTRFSRINGYGSNARAAITVFMTIHSTSPPVNEKINAQLPANFAMASAARCPSVYFSFPLSGLTEILLSASRFNTSSSVISWRISLSTSFSSFLFSFISIVPLPRFIERNCAAGVGISRRSNWILKRSCILRYSLACVSPISSIFSCDCREHPLSFPSKKEFCRSRTPKKRFHSILRIYSACDFRITHSLTPQPTETDPVDCFSTPAVGQCCYPMPIL